GGIALPRWPAFLSSASPPCAREPFARSLSAIRYAAAIAMRQSIHLLLLLAIPGFVPACQRDMAAHRRAWEAARPSSYVFEYQRTCFCPASGAWWRITVKRDSVTDAQLIDSTRVTRGLRYIHTLAQPTLSELFTEIAGNLQ